MDSFFTCDYFRHLNTRDLQRRVKNEAEVRGVIYTYIKSFLSIQAAMMVMVKLFRAHKGAQIVLVVVRNRVSAVWVGREDSMGSGTIHCTG